jgi:hypothetical protein
MMPPANASVTALAYTNVTDDGKITNTPTQNTLAHNIPLIY